jgi:hypothetical protein
LHVQTVQPRSRSRTCCSEETPVNRRRALHTLAVLAAAGGAAALANARPDPVSAVNTAVVSTSTGTDAVASSTTSIGHAINANSATGTAAILALNTSTGSPFRPAVAPAEL